MTRPAYGQTGPALVAGFGAIKASERPAGDLRVLLGATRVGARPAPSSFEPLTRSCAGPGDDDRPACEGSDPDLFFPDSTTSKEGKAQVEVALRVCRSCPRRTECRDEAIDNGETWAIRGGLLPVEIRAYNLRNRGRGRSWA